LQSKSSCIKVPKSKKNRMWYFGEGRFALLTFLYQSAKLNISIIWLSCHFDKGEYPPRGEVHYDSE